MDSNNSQPTQQKSSTDVVWKFLGILVALVVVGTIFELSRSEMSILYLVASALFYRSSREDMDFLTAMGALIIGLGIVIAGSLLKLFWLIALTGLGLTSVFWRNREARNPKAALAFIGIFVTLYGVLGVAFQYIS